MAKERTGYTFQDSCGRWYARVTFTNEHGKRRDIKRSAEDERAAKKILKGMLRELEDEGERSLDTASMTFAELADHYISNYLHEAVYVGERKVSGVRWRYKELAQVSPLIAYFGRRKIRSLTYGDLRAYKTARLNTPTSQNKQRGLPSVHRELSKLRRILNIAVREQWVSRSPFNNGESLISVETHRERVLTRDEDARLLAAIEAEPKRKHLKGIVLIALDCGLRRGEILTLTWGDIDLSRRTITVRAFNAKTARSRTVGMTIRVHEALTARFYAAPRAQDERAFDIAGVKRSFTSACRVAGIEDFRLHDCRHTFITRAIRAGLPPVEVMRVSGHTTMSAFYRYANLDSDTVFRAAAALDAFHAQTAEQQTSNASERIN